MEQSNQERNDAAYQARLNTPKYNEQVQVPSYKPPVLTPDLIETSDQALTARMGN